MRVQKPQNATDQTRQDELFAELVDLPKGLQQSRLGEIAKTDRALAERLTDLIEWESLAIRDGFLNAPLPLATFASPGQTDRELDSCDPEQWLHKKIGQFVINRYIASGGMGHVFEGERVSHVRQSVAIKVLRERIGKEAKQRFKTEARILAELTHPNLMPLIDFGVSDDGDLYFVMPLITGCRLDDFVKENQLTIDQRVCLVLQICDAVQHAHERGIVHRDLKPANVLVNQEHNVLVTDFGLGKIIDSDFEQGDGKWTLINTGVGRILGTPKYLPPEQLAPTKGRSSVRMDVYGIGAILYSVLTGVAPHEAETIAESLIKAKSEIPRSVRSQVPTISRDLDTICQKCLEKNPLSRYRTVAELGDELRRFIRREPIMARPQPAWESVWRWIKRNRLAAFLLAITSATIVASLISLLMLLQNARVSQKQEVLANERSRELASEFLTATADALFLLPEKSQDRLLLQRRVVVVLENFVSQSPEDTKAKYELSQALYKLASTELQVGNKDRASATFFKARDIVVELQEQMPEDANLLFDLAHIQIRLGNCETAIDVLEVLLERPNVNKFHKNCFAETCAKLAIQINARGEHQRALEILSHGELVANELINELDHRETNQPVDFLKTLGVVLSSKSKIFWDLDLKEEACVLAERAVSISDKVVSRNVGRPEFLDQAVAWRISHAYFEFQNGDSLAAISIGLEALRLVSQYQNERSDWRNPYELRFQVNAMLSEVFYFEGDMFLAGFFESEATNGLIQLNSYDSWPDAISFSSYCFCGRLTPLSHRTKNRIVSIMNSRFVNDPGQAIAMSLRNMSEQKLTDTVGNYYSKDFAKLGRLSQFLILCIDSARLVESGNIQNAKLVLELANSVFEETGRVSQRIPDTRLHRFLQDIASRISED